MVVFAGFLQEFRAEKSISALKSMLIQVSIVIRDGKEQEVLSVNIVPEDILVLRNGDKIPADCIILEEKELRVDESILTGESMEVKKSSNKFKFAKESVEMAQEVIRVRLNDIKGYYNK